MSSYSNRPQPALSVILPTSADICVVHDVQEGSPDYGYRNVVRFASYFTP